MSSSAQDRTDLSPHVGVDSAAEDGTRTPYADNATDGNNSTATDGSNSNQTQPDERNELDIAAIKPNKSRRHPDRRRKPSPAQLARYN